MFRFFIALIILNYLFVEKSYSTVPTPDHVVILVLENHGYNQVVRSSASPYINSLINDPFTALFTQSYALSHPSQPNYLQFFSGSTQGVTDDNVPATLPFTTANLGAELQNASRTFIGYSEDLPSVGYTGATSGAYARKHNPWVNWQSTALNGIPVSSNQPFTAFPSDYNLLPTVSFVIPNQNNDMHNGSDPSRITTCDTWIQTNLNAYIQWAKTHNSLLILTFDEDDNASVQHILTLFTGNFVQAGNYSTAINHYNVLRTVEDMYGLTHAGAASSAATIDNCWNNCNLTIPTVTPSGPITLCQGSSVILTASNANNYLWQPNGATTQSTTISTSGNYSVTATFANGCKTSSAPVTVSVLSVQSDATLFVETMGSITTNPTSISTQETNNGFDNDSYSMSGTGDLRNTTVSTGYGTGLPTASGSTNVFLTNTVGKNFIIAGINTSGLTNLELSFGINKSTTTTNGADLLVKVSSDGTNYTSLSFPSLPTGSGTAIWYYRTATGTIPPTANLRIQFIQNGTATQYRIDDVMLKYSGVPTITASGPLTFCQGDSVTLTSSSGANYLWSNGATTQSIKVKSAGSYNVSVNCIASSPVTVTVNTCTIGLNLKVFIEGFYINGGSLVAVANPALHPTICDTIIVELHDTTTTHTLISSARDTLNTNGMGKFYFPSNIKGHHYYVAVKHRNAIETWSKNAILFDSVMVNYDFTVPDTSVHPNPVPVLNSISPSSVNAGSPGFTLTLSGNNFISGSVVKWNGNSLTTTYVSNTQLTALVPAVNISTAGSASITIFNPSPGGGTSGSKMFTINTPPPVIKKFLFDATKAETAGNADWVIDEDASPQRIPTPAQSNITSGTAETYWTGAISSWGIALVKSGNNVETLPSGTAITYGNSSNGQDLSNYNVFVIDEPNILFTAAEKTAILNFVNNGGGLFIVADHTGSDRNNDGEDSRVVLNDLMKNNSIQNNAFGFSIDSTNISQVSSNVRTNSNSNTVLHGSQGNVSQLEFNNGATITINTSANANAQGLIWENSFAQNSTLIMCATSTYGTGRIFLVTDSSPLDDGTGASGNTLYVGWPTYSHTSLFMNASLWLAKLQ